MITIFKNTMNRILSQRVYVTISLLMIVASVLVAIAISNMQHTNGTIAIVKNDVSTELEQKLEKFQDKKEFTFYDLKKEPKKSELVTGKYDVIIYASGSGYRIETMRSDSYKKAIIAVLEQIQPEFPLDNSRSVFLNIIGYVLMFVLLQGILFAKFYADDREHMIRRIFISPLHVSAYLTGSILAFSILTFCPAYITIVVAKLFGVEIGCSLFVYGVLLLLLTVMSTSFAIFIYTVINHEDTANIMGTAIVIITSILSGSFLNLPHDYKIFRIFPQKEFMDLVKVIDSKKSLYENSGKLFYVIGLSLFFFIIAVIKIRNEYITIVSPKNKIIKNKKER